MFVWLVYTGVYQSAWLINEQVLSLGLKSFGWHVVSRCGVVGRVPMRNLSTKSDFIMLVSTLEKLGARRESEAGGTARPCITRPQYAYRVPARLVSLHLSPGNLLVCQQGNM